MQHRSLFLPFLTLLSCNTVFSLDIEHHSVSAALTKMPLCPPKDGQVPPSMVSKALGSVAYRYPQMPLEVDGYAVVPHDLQLEQVHIYVRHGAFLSIKGLRLGAVNSFFFGMIRCSQGNVRRLVSVWQIHQHPFRNTGKCVGWLIVAVQHLTHLPVVFLQKRYP